MGELLYIAIASVDGYIADAEGNFDWSVPDEEVHAFVNELERPIGTYLYGRRLYEVMTGWDQPDLLDDPIPVTRDFATLWQAADKIVYSRTLTAATTGRTRVEPAFDVTVVRDMKAAATAPISVGGATLAAQAIAAGLVDEVHLLLSPVVIGSGTRALPTNGRFDLDLLGLRRFGNGVVHLHYRVR